MRVGSAAIPAETSHRRGFGSGCHCRPYHDLMRPVPTSRPLLYPAPRLSFAVEVPERDTGQAIRDGPAARTGSR
jgi:hypothetical protein